MFLAFVSSRNGNANIYTVRGDGSDLRQITNAPTDEISPSWSPDGAKIAYLVRSGNGDARTSRLVMMDPDGTKDKELVSDKFVYPDISWSPNAQMIVFSGRLGSSRPDLYTLNLSDSSLVNLDHAAETGQLGASLPVWSPDGKHIAFQSPMDTALTFWRLHTIAPDGSDQKQIDSDAIEDRLPQWSPLGNKILFISKSDVGHVPEQLFSIQLDGSARTKITDSPDFKTLFRWSPNAQMIAYAGYRATFDVQGKQTITSAGLYLLGLDSAQITIRESKNKVTRLAWAPDNRHIAFILLEGKELNLYIADICDGTTTIISRNVSEYAPTWNSK